MAITDLMQGNPALLPGAQNELRPTPRQESVDASNTTLVPIESGDSHSDRHAPPTAKYLPQSTKCSEIDNATPGRPASWHHPVTGPKPRQVRTQALHRTRNPSRATAPSCAQNRNMRAISDAVLHHVKIPGFRPNKTSPRLKRSATELQPSDGVVRPMG